MACEFLTPVLPQYFLGLASVANVGRAIALTTYVSTQPAFQQAFCAGSNLADISAKSQVTPPTPTPKKPGEARVQVSAKQNAV